ncbi:hypothetical protein TNCV_1639371 [Trichonephila clavipes]|nr:hypothetical protein TNCV_1639371 [Trichonephila clavipes]
MALSDSLPQINLGIQVRTQGGSNNVILGIILLKTDTICQLKQSQDCFAVPSYIIMTHLVERVATVSHIPLGGRPSINRKMGEDTFNSPTPPLLDVADDLLIACQATISRIRDDVSPRCRAAAIRVIPAPRWNSFVALAYING